MFKISSPSHRFNGHFPGGPELAGTRMPPFWIILELRMMEVVVTTGAVRRAKLHPNCHHQQTNNQLFTGRIPFLSPNKQCQSTEGKDQTITCTRKFNTISLLLTGDLSTVSSTEGTPRLLSMQKLIT